jgi:hypothetical protein
LVAGAGKQEQQLQQHQQYLPRGADICAASKQDSPVADCFEEIREVPEAQQEGSHRVAGVPAEQDSGATRMCLPSGSSKAALPALCSPGRINAARPATAALPLGPAAAGLGHDIASLGAGKRQSAGL